MPEALRAILGACAPDLRWGSIEEIQDGWDSAVFVLDGSQVIRVPRRQDVRDQLEREVELLPWLAPRLPTRVPAFNIICRDSASGRIEAVGYPLIVGTSLSELIRSGADVGATQGGLIATDIAAFLSALHAPSIDIVPKGIARNDQVAWTTRFEAMYAEVAAIDLPPDARRYVDQLFGGFLRGISAGPFAPALIHGDLAADHVLCSANGERLVAVIDWGDAVVGDVALDFVTFLANLGVDFVRRLLADYKGPADDLLIDRARFYQNIRPIHALIHADRTAEDAMRNEAVAEISRAAAASGRAEIGDV